jgi:predicted kinase
MTQPSAGPQPRPPEGTPRGVVYLLCGLAFSGKSTLAAALAERLGAKVVSLDEINARRDLRGGEGVADEEWAATHRQALREVEGHMRRGTPYIVVDDTSCFRFLRDDHRKLAARHGYRLRLLLLITPLQEIRRRMGRAAETGERRGLAPQVFAEHTASFESPGEEESPLAVPWQVDPASWIGENLL